jgi:hypothetical protein
MKQSIIGALAGWKHEPSGGGLKLTLQIAESAKDFEEKAFQQIIVALNTRQLRSFARDIVRAAESQDIPLFARKKGIMQRIGFS